MYKGSGQSIDVKIAVVVAEFNSYITESLLKGALETLENSGVNKSNIEVFKVPGAFEIPLMCEKIFAASKAEGIITLGAVIRGETPHFDFVAGSCANGVMRVSLDYKKPISFGVLTTDSVEQALNRAGIKYGNKGVDAAQALIGQLKTFQEANI
ncbi:MAG: 6,7-dimethyl-8-ribityllumazine synthase [Leptospirales bacterium]